MRPHLLLPSAVASAVAVTATGLLVQGCSCDCEPRPYRPARPVARDVSRDPVGTTFTFAVEDQPTTTLEVTWLAPDQVKWVRKWPAAYPGPRHHPPYGDHEERGEGPVEVSELRPRVTFARWVGSGWTTLQVIDLAAGRAATTAILPDGATHHVRETVRPTAGTPPTDGSPTDLTGRRFTLDLGAGAATRVTFAAKDRLAWEELRGPAKGQRGEAEIESTEVRPGLMFLRWRDGERLVAAVLDLDLRRAIRTTVTGETLDHAEGALLDAD